MASSFPSLLGTYWPEHFPKSSGYCWTTVLEVRDLNCMNRSTTTWWCGQCQVASALLHGIVGLFINDYLQEWTFNVQILQVHSFKRFKEIQSVEWIYGWSVWQQGNRIKASLLFKRNTGGKKGGNRICLWMHSKAWSKLTGWRSRESICISLAVCGFVCLVIGQLKPLGHLSLRAS